MKKNAFFVNTAILAATSIFLRVIGIYVISFLTERIGAEGIGLFQLIFSVYTLAAAFAVSGVSVAVTRLVAENMEKALVPVSVVMKRSISFAAIVSVCIAFLLYNLSSFIGASVLNDPRTILPLQILAPSLPFMAISACLRGYLVGAGKIARTASSSIFEEIVHLSVIIGTIGFFLPQGLEAACVCIVIASLVSEILGCLYLLILYKTGNRQKPLERPSQKGVLKKILGISMPIAASFYLRSSLRTAEGILIPSSLERYGLTNAQALSQYGIIVGMSMPVLFFPTVLLFPVSTLLVPEIARFNAAGNRRRVGSTVSRVIRLALLLSVLCCVIFLLFSDSLGQVIYNSREAGAVLAILAPLTPLIYMDIMVDAMLNGLNQQIHTMKYSIADSLIRIALIFVLIPLFGVAGFFIAIFAGTVLNSLLSLRRLVRVAEIRLDVMGWIVKPFLAAGAAGSCVLLLFNILAGGIAANGLLLALQISLSVLLYICFLFWTGCITRQDVRWLKKRLNASQTSPRTFHANARL